MCSESCGNGTEGRSRGFYTEVANGGKECEGPETQNRDCEIVPCPIDCVWADWAGWSACSEDCGDGEQERTRAVNVHSMYGGLPCEGPELEAQECMVKECPVIARSRNGRKPARATSSAAPAQCRSHARSPSTPTTAAMLARLT